MLLKTLRKVVRRKGAESGQSLVEFALSGIVLIIILSGLLDFGRLYYIYVALEDGAGEAALYLSLNPACPCDPDDTECTSTNSGNDVYCADPNNADHRARESAGGIRPLDWSDARIIVDVPDVYVIGDTVTVHIEYDFEPITPFVTRLFEGRPITLRVVASQIIVSEQDIH